MKCLDCNTEWNDIESVVFPRNCPFCGGDTAELSTAKALRYIRKQFGNKIFLDKNKLVALLKDLLIDNPSDVKTISLIEMDDFHNYYIRAWKVNDMQKRAVVLKQARDYLMNIGLRDEKIEQVDYAYQVAWGLKFECTKDADFQDKNDEYYNLGKKYLKENKITEAAEVFSISERSGNVKSCIALCEMIRDGYLPAAVALNKACKDHLSVWQRDLVEQIADEDKKGEVIESLLFDIPCIYMSGRGLTKMYKKTENAVFVFWLDYLDNRSDSSLEYLFHCEENENGRFISNNEYVSLSIYKNSERYDEETYYDETVQERSDITKRIIDYAIAKNKLDIASKFIYISVNNRRLNSYLTEYDFINVYLEKMPENQIVYSVALTYFKEKSNWERELELLSKYEEYDYDIDYFRIAQILIENDKDPKMAYDMAKAYLAAETKRNNNRTWIPAWAPSDDKIMLLKWFVKKTMCSANDIMISLNYMISDSRYLFVYTDEELCELLSLVFNKKKWQKKTNDLAINILEVVSTNNDYQNSWNLLMLELLKKGDLKFETFCTKLLIKSIESPQYISDVLVNQIIADEKRFFESGDCSRVTWEFLYILKTYETLQSNWDRSLVEKCILIIQKSKIEYECDSDYEERLRAIQAVYYSYSVRIAMECVKKGHVQLGKALVNDINLNNYLSLINELELVSAFIALFVDCEKQAEYKKLLSIEADFQTDTKYAYNIANKAISAFDKVPTKECEKGPLNPYSLMGYIFEKGLIGESSIEEANEMYLKGAMLGDYVSEIKVADMGINFIVKDNVLFSYPESHKGEYDVVIPEDVNEIAPYGMYCYKIKKVSIPGSVKVIGAYAFSDCDDLEYVEIKNGTEYLASNCFNCGKNTELHIYVPRSVKHIEENVFSDNVIIHCKKTAPIKKYAEVNNIKYVIE